MISHFLPCLYNSTYVADREGGVSAKVLQGRTVQQSLAVKRQSRPTYVEVAKLRRAHYEGCRRVVLSSMHRLHVHVERSAGRLRQWKRRREIAEGWREIKRKWMAR